MHTVNITAKPVETKEPESNTTNSSSYSSTSSNKTSSNTSTSKPSTNTNTSKPATPSTPNTPTHVKRCHLWCRECLKEFVADDFDSAYAPLCAHYKTHYPHSQGAAYLMEWY